MKTLLPLVLDKAVKDLGNRLDIVDWNRMSIPLAAAVVALGVDVEAVFMDEVCNSADARLLISLLGLGVSGAAVEA